MGGTPEPGVGIGGWAVGVRHGDGSPWAWRSGWLPGRATDGGFRSWWWRHPARPVVVAALIAVTAGCATTDTMPAPEDPGPLHVHALAVDPENDDAVLAATHTGLFRLDGDGQERVSEHWHDLMAFAVVDDGVLVASGHPALDAEHLRVPDRPPHLGLVRSDDGGRSWTAVSLLGEADFHALVVAEGLLFGAEATTGRLLASADGGRSWQDRSPVALVSLAARPDGQLLVGSTSDGVVRSDDGGWTWMPVMTGPAVLAATESGFVAADPDGQVKLSFDGVTWQRVGRLPSAPEALLVDPGRLYAWTAEHRLLVSDDAGASWHPRIADR